MSDRQAWTSELFERRRLDVERLAAAAAVAEDDVGACCAWMAVQRQARRHLRALQPYLRTNSPALSDTVAASRADLEGRLASADSTAATFGAEVQARARARLGLRVAVIGKGGSGKTVIAGTLGRLLAGRGRRVLAGDLDTNPGLAYTLGMSPTEAGLPWEAVEEQPGSDYGWYLASSLSPLDAVERFAAVGPDGVRYLGIGKVSSSDKAHARRSSSAVRAVLGGLGEPGWDVIGDLEGGPTTPFERYHAFADLVIVVAGPSWVSGLTARRLLALVELPTLVVTNRMEDGAEHQGIVPVLAVPHDPEVLEAERRGVAPVDFCPGAPAMRAIAQLADMLTPEEVSV
ncbi:MAG: hypothetical protein ABIS21_01580 [Acidimicrobiales bacterium]